MSESLPETAPLEPAAVTSDEVTAPAGTQEVVEESARGVDSVPAARFNGLMGKFNQTQSALAAAQQRIAELEAAPVVQEESVSDASGLQQQVAALQHMLMEERLEKVRAQAIQEFPGAAAFADLIIADTPEAVREMAKVLHERVGQAAPPVAAAEAEETVVVPEPGTEAAAEVVVPPAAPQVAGGTSITEIPADAREKVTDAIKRRSFSDFLRAKAAESGIGKDDLVL